MSDIEIGNEKRSWFKRTFGPLKHGNCCKTFNIKLKLIYNF